jgi:adenylate cyclase class IV
MTSLYKDFTLKARVTNRNKIEAILETLHAQCVGLDFQTDTYYKTERGKLKFRQGTIENLITHYERIHESDIERTIVYRYEVNPSKKEIERLATDRKVIGIIKKQRAIYVLPPCKIHLDRLNEQEFLEIEAIDREDKFSSEELKMLCLSLKDKLEISNSDLLPTGYLKL